MMDRKKDSVRENENSNEVEWLILLVWLELCPLYYSTIYRVTQNKIGFK